MKFRVEIDCDNDAFKENAGEEVGRILRNVVGIVETGGCMIPYNLRDHNGNIVGTAGFEE